MDVLRALLWAFHNAKSGACFPSYEAIAEKANCKRDTVRHAIEALEDGKHADVDAPPAAHRWPRHPHVKRLLVPRSAPNTAPKPSKAENLPGTKNQGFLLILMSRSRLSFWIPATRWTRP